jgi:hypothetical protein
VDISVWRRNIRSIGTRQKLKMRVLPKPSWKNWTYQDLLGGKIQQLQFPEFPALPTSAISNMAVGC